MVVDNEMRQEMINALTEALEYKAIPEGAQSIGELAPEFPGMSKGQVREAIGKFVAAGRWAKGRRGNKVLYWPIA